MLYLKPESIGISIGIGSLRHTVVCAETLKMLIFDAIIFGGSFYKISTSAGTISNQARTASTVLRSVY